MLAILPALWAHVHWKNMKVLALADKLHPGLNLLGNVHDRIVVALGMLN